MTSLLTIAEYEARAAVSLHGNDLSQVEAFIVDASAEVLDVGNPNWTAADVPATAKAVVFQMVRRAVANPDGFLSETIGDYSYQRSADDGGATSAMRLTRDETRKVRRAAAKTNVTTVGVRRPNAYEREFTRYGGDPDELTL